MISVLTKQNCTLLDKDQHLRKNELKEGEKTLCHCQNHRVDLA